MVPIATDELNIHHAVKLEHVPSRRRQFAVNDVSVFHKELAILKHNPIGDLQLIAVIVADISGELSGC